VVSFSAIKGRQIAGTASQGPLHWDHITRGLDQGKPYCCNAGRRNIRNSYGIVDGVGLGSDLVSNVPVCLVFQSVGGMEHGFEGAATWPSSEET
jgi:hypothetical protein